MSSRRASLSKSLSSLRRETGRGEHGQVGGSCVSERETFG